MMSDRKRQALCALGLLGWLAAGERAWAQMPAPAAAQATPPSAASASGVPPSAASPEQAPPSAATPDQAPPSAATPDQAPPGAAAQSGALAPGAAAAQAAPSGRGPAIDLPPEASSPPSEQGPIQLGVAATDDTLLRGLEPQRMSQSRTVIGGYGQFGLNALRIGSDGRFDAHANVERVVLFVAHPITDDIRIYTEFEWENALACAPSCLGSAEVEQAYVQWRLSGDLLALRTGLVLIPMGIINQWHEPPVFHGVERPMVDQLIIPTTWRELGVGFTGNWQQQLRYELYLTTTLNPLRTSSTAGLTENGIAGATGEGSLVRARAFAVTGRVEVEPWLGVIAGASFFLSNIGPNGDYFDAAQQRLHITLPVLGYALDARMRRAGFEARAVWAQFFLPNSDALLNAFDDHGNPLFPAGTMEGGGTLPERIQGGYLELAYNVFARTKLSHELLGFVRLEYYNTQASVPDGYSANAALDVRELTMGITYRPITQLVFKTDLQLRDRRLGLDELQYNLGFGYMF
jgi:hypothetical protein